MPSRNRTEETPNLGHSLSWLILALDVFLAGAYLFLSLSNGHGRFSWDSLAFAVFPLTAAVVIRRQPRNPIGWTMAMMGFIFLLGNVTSEYAYYTFLTRPGSLPFPYLISWISATVWTLGFPLIIATILFFPNGAPPSRRWWALIGLATFPTLLFTGYLMVLFWPARGPRLLSPEISSMVGPAAAQPAQTLLSIWNNFYVVCLVLAVVGMAFRLARSRGIERQQLKWTFLAMTVVPLGVGSNLLFCPTGNSLIDSILVALNLASIISFPIAMAFAITRYRLYDIDVIIRRTLLYSALTLTLALFYFGSVFLLQTLLARIGGQQSPVIVVLSTLLIAALFSPLRARFQKVIDRRFYRRAYNSEQILARFTDRLRTEVDLESIHAHLLDLVDESLQPAFSTLWLVEDNKLANGKSAHRNLE